MKYILALIVVLLSNQLKASKSVCLVIDGKANYSICVTNNKQQLALANTINKYIEMVSGTTLMVTELHKQRQIIFAPPPDAKINIYNQKADAFCISIHNENIYIFSNTAAGMRHVVYVFIERYLHVYKFSEKLTYTKQQTLCVEPMNLCEEPAFETRSLYYAATTDTTYYDWHGLNGKHDEKNDDKWGMWVHTFKNLIPDSVYFNTHPEYFAFNGVRRRSQLCLSNKEVLQTVINNLRKMMQKDTASLFWSVSQNDNYEYCNCNACKTTDSIEGSQSGTMLRFVNAVAAAFPNKIISTLAYQYTRKPPLITKPAKNVNIMFCSIECGRHLPIEDDPDAAQFRNDFEGWCKLTDNIIVWDYVVQFSNYVSPFPNLHVLQPNIQYFYEHGVRHMFEQASGNVWSDNMALKSYLIAALLWNPYVDVDSLTEKYALLQYGNAAEDMLTYFADLEQQVKQSGAGLDIYGNPITPNNTWLKPEQLSEYESYFESALKNTPTSFHYEIKKLKLPLQYSRLEQAKFYGIGNLGVFENNKGTWQLRQQIKTDLDNFIADCKQLEVTYLNENTYSIFDYEKAWHRIFANGMQGHKAMGAIVTLTPTFSSKYPAKGIETLIDGCKGYDDYRYNWLGWEGTSLEAVVKLKHADSVQSIAVDFMQFQKSWIFYPESVSFHTSIDGVTYHLVKTCQGPTLVTANNFDAHTYKVDFPKQLLQFIKVEAKSILQCPVWHIGAGHDSWIFCDEIIVH
jgi:hypothetical protein